MFAPFAGFGCGITIENLATLSIQLQLVRLFEIEWLIMRSLSRRGEVKREYEFFERMPIVIYRYSADGRIAFCNRTARELFNVSEELTSLRIRDFLAKPISISSTLKKLQRSGGFLRNLETEFAIGAQRVFLSESHLLERAKKDEDSTILVFATDITEMVEERQLLEGLPIGVYKIDSEDRIVRANQAAATILGYENADDLLGAHIGRHYRKSEDLDTFLAAVLESDSDDGQIIEMFRTDGQPIIVRASSTLVEHKGISFRIGAFLDVTASQKVTRALGKLPSGYYEVRDLGPESPISYCNTSFARMFGYSGPNEVVGKVRAIDLHADVRSWEQYMNALAEHDARSAPLNNHHLHVKRKDGKLFWVAIDCSIEVDQTGNVICREGVVRDVTEQVALGQTVRDLKSDLERTTRDVDMLVHRYTSPMIGLDSSLRILAETIQQISAGFLLSDVDIEGWGDKLLSAIDEVAVAAMSEEDCLDCASLQRCLEEQRGRLSHSRFKEHQRLQQANVRDVATRVIKEIRGGDCQIRNQSLLEHLERVTMEILSLDAMRSVSRLQAVVSELSTAIESMRLHFNTGKEDDHMVRLDFVELLNSVLDSSDSTAHEEGLAFIVEAPDCVELHGSRRDLRRAISNVVMNAVKYSYRREEGFVRIKVSRDHGFCSFSVQSYGVPITREELDSGSLFEYGIRGALSRDHNRMGSGIGLADVSKTVLNHNGEVEISSVPAVHTTSEADYSFPYLTTVTIRLPLTPRRQNVQDPVD